MTRRLLLTSIVGLFLLPAAAVGQYDVNSPKLRIQWEEFKKLYDAKKIVVVDVRDEQSFKVRHIPGAMLVPLDQVEKRVAEIRKLGKPVVTYCA